MGRQKRKDWPALGEVKAGEAAEGGPEDEAADGRSEEETEFWDEPAFRNNQKDFSQITYQIQHVHVQIHIQISERTRRAHTCCAGCRGTRSRRPVVRLRPAFGFRFGRKELALCSINHAFLEDITPFRVGMGAPVHPLLVILDSNFHVVHFCTLKLILWFPGTLS